MFSDVPDCVTLMSVCDLSSSKIPCPLLMWLRRILHQESGMSNTALRTICHFEMLNRTEVQISLEMPGACN